MRERRWDSSGELKNCTNIPPDVDPCHRNNSMYTYLHYIYESNNHFYSGLARLLFPFPELLSVLGEAWHVLARSGTLENCFGTIRQIVAFRIFFYKNESWSIHASMAGSHPPKISRAKCKETQSSKQPRAIARILLPSHAAKEVSSPYHDCDCEA